YAVRLDDGQSALVRHFALTFSKKIEAGCGKTVLARASPTPPDAAGRVRRCETPYPSSPVYPGGSARGNFAESGSADFKRLFVVRTAARDPGRGRQEVPAGLRPQTEKLSPQPHSPLTFG